MSIAADEDVPALNLLTRAGGLGPGKTSSKSVVLFERQRSSFQPGAVFASNQSPNRDELQPRISFPVGQVVTDYSPFQLPHDGS